ncbi:23S rRNA (adenine(1618)-N(6))-methyltransferase RlmF [Thaumasiovibrio subtropicus]|uniref:23S rRNA (adenine(1618)-N(6))-methyltransferase RlmF n=1 Tax=Thaumasiovibrio subtropicus TaxID=1891207 RepID=UPI000B350B77|nr:23S rRNA (adenine(1618)-N(6))-methyltransferase RlmF [Thaumasiovibrio subtropicus]
MKPSKNNVRLHHRNKHKNGYNFELLTKVNPNLKPWLTRSPAGRTTIPFSEPDAVLELNRALLAADYGVAHWDIPAGNLCPPIPGRAEYIHYLADLLKESNAGKVPNAKYICGLDVGVGANCIYPILGSAEYGWHFWGSDIQMASIKSAKQIVNGNPNLKKKISLYHQKDKNAYFKGVISKDSYFTFTMCNPPFHRSAQEATQGSQRKNKNLQNNKYKRGQQPTSSNPKSLNFGGNAAELWCKGGEQGFILNMVAESQTYAEQVLWFTSLVSKSENLRPIKKALEKTKVADSRVIEMRHGNKVSRFIAWTYHPVDTHTDWFR